MRTRKERRYLTEKYQNKQVRLAYTFVYEKPYDRERYIRTEFARKRRFVDMLYGNYVEWGKWGPTGIGQWEPHAMSREELGRYRNHSFSDCGRKRCPSCCSPRKRWSFSTGDERITMQERIAKLNFEEEITEYKEKRDEKVKSIIAR